MNFLPLTVSDYQTVKGFFNDQPYSLSIYSPASLIAWGDAKYKSLYAVAEGILFIAGESKEHPEQRHLILPVSGARDFPLGELHHFARKLGFPRFWYVPSDYLEKADQSELQALFTIEEQEEYADYVYLTEDLIRLKGNKYAKKRNLIHQFSREYLWKDRVSIETIDSRQVDECLHFLEAWCDERSCEIEEKSGLACEKDAVTTTLKHIEELESTGILIRIDGKVSAFGIGSRLNRTTATLNFEKAFAGIKGLYQFLDNECAKRLFAAYRYINKESDMNLPNLAESKKSYHPISRIKSFALHLR